MHIYIYIIFNIFIISSKFKKMILLAFYQRIVENNLVYIICARKKEEYVASNANQSEDLVDAEDEGKDNKDEKKINCYNKNNSNNNKDDIKNDKDIHKFTFNTINDLEEQNILNHEESENFFVNDGVVIKKEENEIFETDHANAMCLFNVKANKTNLAIKTKRIDGINYGNIHNKVFIRDQFGQ